MRKEIKLKRPDRAEGGANLNPALVGVLDGFSAHVINDYQKQLWGGMGLSVLQVTVYHQRKPGYEAQSQELKQRPWRNAGHW